MELAAPAEPVEQGAERLATSVATLLASVLAVATPAFAQTAQIAPSLNASGTSGLSVTPTARLLNWGTASMAYDSTVVGGPNTRRYGSEGHNFVAGFGLLPNLEISGRIAASTINDNCYTQQCGIRDLSFNAKAGAALDRDNRWHVAAGATDIGGQTGNFRTAFGVVSYTPVDPVDLSLGYSMRRGSATTPLHGPFASAAYRPLAWLQTHVEYVDSKAWAGARVYAPANWLPDGWQAHIGANVRVAGDQNGAARSWLSVGLNVPLYKVPTRSATGTRAEYSTQGIPASDVPLVADMAPRPVAVRPSNSGVVGPLAMRVSDPAPITPVTQITPTASVVAPTPVSDDQLIALGDALRAKGFEDIAIGRAPDGAIAVRLNNAVYNANTADGLGVALGVIARRLADQRAGYRLVLLQRQLAIVGVTGQADCLAQWIAAGPPKCTAGQLYTNGTTGLDALLAGTRWTVDGQAPSWKTPRLILQPVVRSAVATEYGVFDHSLALRAMVQQPLWSGAWLEVAGNAPLHNSDDYKRGQVFGQSRFDSQVDRYMAHQMFRVPVEKLFGADNAQNATRWGANAVTAHVAAGRIDANYRGTYAEMRWEPGEGRHRIQAEAGKFDRVTFYDANLPINSKTALASYRYAFTPTRTYFEATGGQFLYNDRGVRFGIKQWFDDVSVTLYVRHTKFEWAGAGRTSAGIELNIPLTPRKDMSPNSSPVQVVGNPRWAYGVETTVREDRNVLNTTQGVGANVSMLDRTFNFDRSGLVYFEDNMPRIRSAARR